MAGHSQFKNIMHRKGRQDAAKSKLFGKLAREITVAAKLGMPDPAMNPRLRAAVIAARAENMPKDNIERAIKKASGGDAENYDEIRYEGYGPGGVAVIVETLTDNRNRTAGEVRATFTKCGGNLAETLGNLSALLRGRQQLRLKIRAFTSEARATMLIMSSLPFVVGGLLFFISPNYMDPLFFTEAGQMVAAGAALSMGFGIFVMKKIATIKV